MSNQLMVPGSMSGGVPAHLQHLLQGRADGKELSGGIEASFAVLSLRGKAWHIKWRGEEYTLWLPANQEMGIAANTVPKPSVEVVIVKGSPVISKNYYPNGYVQGSDDPPVCFSTDGAAPDPASPAKQSAACATCQHNIWGSKILPDGKKVKACQDLKRVAVTPARDIANEAFGGPMLLRVPPGSLKNMDAFNQQLQAQGIPYFAVKTRISFDPAAEYPLLKFEAMEWLTEDETVRVLALQDGAVVKRILSEPVDRVRNEQLQPGQVGSQPALAPPVQQPVPPVAPVVAPPPQPIVPVAPTPVVVAPVAPPPPAPVVMAPVPPTPAPIAPPPAVPSAGQVQQGQDVNALLAALAAAGVDTSKLATGTAPAPKPRKARTANPSPAPTPEVIEGQATVVPPTPAAVAPPVAAPMPTPVAPPVAETPLTAQPGAGAAATTGLVDKLSGML